MNPRFTYLVACGPRTQEVGGHGITSEGRDAAWTNALKAGRSLADEVGISAVVTESEVHDSGSFTIARRRLVEPAS